jgi:hypothetical protein
VLQIVISVSEEPAVSIFMAEEFPTLKTEALGSSEKLIMVCQTTWRQIPDNKIFVVKVKGNSVLIYYRDI